MTKWCAAVLVPMVMWAADDAAVTRGEKVYGQQCASAPCHGSSGAAGKAPRLRARKLEEAAVRTAILKGTPNMSGYEGKLGKGDLDAVTAYVMSLQNAPAQVQASAAPAGEFKGPEPAKRGYALFFDASKPTHCGVCHAISGRGTPVGPDLTRLARIAPRAISMAVTSTRSQYAVILKPKSGKEFPAMKIDESDPVTVYDLSVMPPELKKIPKADIASMTDNNVWKHPPSGEGYTAEQLADIISFIRFASFGDPKGITAEDLQ